MLDGNMDWSLLQLTGLIVLGWIVLAVVVGFIFALFVRGALHLERQLPASPRAIRAWVRGHKSGRKATRVA